MILGIVFLAVAVLFGLAAVRRLGAAESLEELIAYGPTAGLVASAFILLAASLAFGFTQPVIAAVTLALAFAAAFLARVPRNRDIHKIHKSKSVCKGVSRAFVALAILSTAFFGYLLSTHYLEPRPDGLYSGGSTWGDLAFHSTATASMAFGGNFPPQNPVFPGTRLNYHFLADFLSAALAVGGFSLRDALLVPSLLAGVLAILSFYVFSKKLAGNAGKKAALVAVAILVLNGGLGFAYFLQDAVGWVAAQDALAGTQYAHIEGKGIFFSNFVADIFLPQRPALFGFAAVFAILGILANARAGREKRGRRDEKLLLAAGVFAGMLPILHAHSFIALLFAAVAWAVIERDSKWLWFLVPAALVALPQALWIMPEAGTSFVRAAFGWMNPLNPLDPLSWLDFARFWVMNAGIATLLVFPAYLAAGKELRRFYLPFAAIFVVANAFSFQPWQWDNIKILVYWFAATAVVVAAWLVRAWENGIPRVAGGKAAKAAVAVLLVLMVLTGALSICREAGLSWKMFGAEDVTLAEWVEANTPPDAIFLSSDQHNSFLALSGRKTVMGYRGWLWSHGINYAQREKDVMEMFAGGPRAMELLGKYGVGYAAIGPAETAGFGADKGFFGNNFAAVHVTPDYVIYRIR
ncbi:MAG: hypothetical protein NTY90_03430 [Candidatus Micrarchaeota archaeon]|nr:hypothetical protein [Candidatus Micrarchaeota archaeon]